MFETPSHTYHLLQYVTFSPQWTSVYPGPGWLHRISPGGSDGAPFPELFLKTKFGSAVPGLRTGEIITTSYELRTFLDYYKLRILPTFAHVILFSPHFHFVR